MLKHKSQTECYLNKKELPKDRSWITLLSAFTVEFTCKIIPMLLLAWWDDSSSSTYQPGRRRISQYPAYAFNNIPFSTRKPWSFPPPIPPSSSLPGQVWCLHKSVALPLL